MVILAKGNEITGCDSTELDGHCGWLLKRGLIIFQSSQFILKKKKKSAEINFKCVSASVFLSNF